MYLTSKTYFSRIMRIMRIKSRTCTCKISVRIRADLLDVRLYIVYFPYPKTIGYSSLLMQVKSLFSSALNAKGRLSCDVANIIPLDAISSNAHAPVF